MFLLPGNCCRNVILRPFACVQDKLRRRISPSVTYESIEILHFAQNDNPYGWDTYLTRNLGYRNSKSVRLLSYHRWSGYKQRKFYEMRQLEGERPHSHIQLSALPRLRAFLVQ